MILARKSLISSSSLWIAALLFVLVAPRATEAQVCAVPGSDGPGGTLSGVINTYYPGTGNASAGATSISVGTPTGSSTPIAIGDLLLVIQMQDAAISYSANDNTYGDGFAGDPGSGSTNLNSSGRYEYVVATSTAGATVGIRGTGSGNGLVNSYNNAAHREPGPTSLSSDPRAAVFERDAWLRTDGAPLGWFDRRHFGF